MADVASTLSTPISEVRRMPLGLLIRMSQQAQRIRQSSGIRL